MTHMHASMHADLDQNTACTFYVHVYLHVHACSYDLHCKHELELLMIPAMPNFFNAKLLSFVRRSVLVAHRPICTYW